MGVIVNGFFPGPFPELPLVASRGNQQALEIKWREPSRVSPAMEDPSSAVPFWRSTPWCGCPAPGGPTARPSPMVGS
ncbi:MAG: hypothetical protein CM15mP18_0140 [Methanobacteriota archaeon]|nr:MAG: hypothetical protein CM15mP18_0140 [Euryarchaeota archaeon]